MKYLIDTQKFFEDVTPNVVKPDYGSIITQCLGFLSLGPEKNNISYFKDPTWKNILSPYYSPQNKTTKLDPAIETFKKISKGQSVSQVELDNVKPIIDYVVFLNNDKLDASTGIQLTSFQKECDKKFGIKPTEVPKDVPIGKVVANMFKK
jgi:hypothetical protein